MWINIAMLIAWSLLDLVKFMQVIRNKNNPKCNFEYYKTLNDIFTRCEKTDGEKIDVYVLCIDKN